MSIVRKAKAVVKESKIVDIDIFTISNYLTNEAIRKYIKEYKTFKVPFKFVAFFFSELSSFPKIYNDSILKQFFEKMQGKDIEVMCFVYFLTFQDIIKTCAQNKMGEYDFYVSILKTPSSMSYRLNSNPKLSNSLKILSDSIDALEEADEIKGIKPLYNSWVAANPSFIKEIQATDVIREQFANKQMADEKKKKEDFSMFGKKVDIPDQPSKKVYRLFIPSLPLPSAYPKSEKNRIHSSYHVKSFTSPADAISFISNKKINGVKYTKSFYDLRMEASAKKQEKKWNDFF